MHKFGRVTVVYGGTTGVRSSSSAWPIKPWISSWREFKNERKKSSEL
jgi:hypothetical protein